MTKLESGDVLVVTKLDRLGRSAIDVRATVDELTKLGVRVHCLALGGVDLTRSRENDYASIERCGRVRARLANRAYTVGP